MGYCTIADVLSLMPPTVVDGIINDDIMEKPITEDGIQYFIDYSSEIVDSTLSQAYIVPLTQIIIVDKTKVIGSPDREKIVFPYPIKDITALLANAYIYKKLYSESQNPQELPKYSEDYQNQAYNLLTQIISGAVNLKGQRQISRRYLRPESMNVNRLPIDIKDFGSN